MRFKTGCTAQLIAVQYQNVYHLCQDTDKINLRIQIFGKFLTSENYILFQALYKKPMSLPRLG